MMKAQGQMGILLKFLLLDIGGFLVRMINAENNTTLITQKQGTCNNLHH